MVDSVTAEIDRRLAVTRVPGSPNNIIAIDLHEWAVEYLREHDEELEQFAELVGKPHWNLWMMDTELKDALFAVLEFRPEAVGFMCGTVNSFAIQGSWCQRTSCRLAAK